MDNTKMPATTSTNNSPLNSNSMIGLISTSATNSSTSLSSSSATTRVVVRRVSSSSTGIRRHHHHHHRQSAPNSTVSIPVPFDSSGCETVIQLPCSEHRVRTVTAAVLWPSSPIHCGFKSSRSPTSSSRITAYSSQSWTESRASPRSSSSAAAVVVGSPSKPSATATVSSRDSLPVLVSSILDGALRKHSELSERRAIACQCGGGIEHTSMQD